ncbi:MAG: 16S rRNA (cytidine(1402)-2'-O)-methyltransferase [Candidatus Omnitrophica bacterium 4484_70.1]|nr:MAG: 16S rRNA (cytidine(1402)-2'-O)-methyltransferase [Candidatus Omnitrophica bacterium 4484_70.1]
MLYIVATPIGNLEDITLRALRIFREAEFIVAEDTRKTGNLLKHFGISKKSFLSLHKFNERRQIVKIISLLKEEKKVALVSNAGTPLVSDPGERLIKEAYKEGIKITAVPGPCAVINALVLSGFSTRKFLFLGFLQKKRNSRLKELKEAKSTKATLIIFESPFRIKKLLEDLAEVFGGKTKVAILREMTKVYEEIRIGLIEEVRDSLGEKVKGEITVVVENER